MIKVKMRNLLQIALSSSLQTLTNTRMNARAAYRVQKIFRQVEQEIKEFEEVRLRLVKQFEPDADGKLSPEAAEAFSKEIQPLLDEDVEFEVTPLTLADLEGVQLSPSELALLEPFITE